MNRERRKNSVLGIKKRRSAAVRGRAPGAPSPPGSASVIEPSLIMVIVQDDPCVNW